MSAPSPKRRRLSGEFTPALLPSPPPAAGSQPARAVRRPADLATDTEPLYKLCQQPPRLSSPHASQDLIQLFRLHDIADSVRRVDPRTGEKINKLRKSYEGKVKDLRLAGRNKAVTAPGQWIPNLLLVPDDNWHATHALGKEIEKGLEGAFAAKLVRAMSLAPGKLPEREAEHWRNILATDDPVARPPPKPALAAASAPVADQKQQVAAKVAAMAGASAAASVAEAAKALRPERVGTKRSYKDASFMGYGEGFEDDETDSDGRPLASLRRKRRKEDFGGVPNSTAVWATS